MNLKIELYLRGLIKIQKRVILFGTGSSSGKIKRIIDFSNCFIVGYADNDLNKQKIMIDNCKVYSPFELENIDFDYIIISSIYFDEIYEQLIALGVSKEKIVDVYKYIRYREVDLKLKETKKIEADILITGMSYARYGFDELTLKYTSINLSFNSQDLFYDYCMVKKILEDGKKFKYALIGLAYYDFQFNLALSKEKHLVNRYFLIEDIQREVSIEKYKNQIAPSIEKVELNFSEVIEKIFVANFIDKFDTLIQEGVVKKNINAARSELARKHSSKNYPQTVVENKKIFRELLSLLKQHNVRPLIVVHPQAKEYQEHFSSKMIEEFNQIISEVQEDFNIEVIDLFKDVRFCEEDFYDVHHLNRRGAQKVSRIINEVI